MDLLYSNPCSPRLLNSNPGLLKDEQTSNSIRAHRVGFPVACGLVHIDHIHKRILIQTLLLLVICNELHPLVTAEWNKFPISEHYCIVQLKIVDTAISLSA